MNKLLISSVLAIIIFNNPNSAFSSNLGSVLVKTSAEYDICGTKIINEPITLNGGYFIANKAENEQNPSKIQFSKLTMNGNAGIVVKENSSLSNETSDLPFTISGSKNKFLLSANAAFIVNNLTSSVDSELDAIISKEASLTFLNAYGLLNSSIKNEGALIVGKKSDLRLQLNDLITDKDSKIIADEGCLTFLGDKSLKIEGVVSAKNGGSFIISSTLNANKLDIDKTSILAIETKGSLTISEEAFNLSGTILNTGELKFEKTLKLLDDSLFSQTTGTTFVPYCFTSSKLEVLGGKFNVSENLTQDKQTINVLNEGIIDGQNTAEFLINSTLEVNSGKVQNFKKVVIGEAGKVSLSNGGTISFEDLELTAGSQFEVKESSTLEITGKITGDLNSLILSKGSILKIKKFENYGENIKCNGATILPTESFGGNITLSQRATLDVSAPNLKHQPGTIITVIGEGNRFIIGANRCFENITFKGKSLIEIVFVEEGVQAKVNSQKFVSKTKDPKGTLPGVISKLHLAKQETSYICAENQATTYRTTISESEILNYPTFNTRSVLIDASKIELFLKDWKNTLTIGESNTTLHYSLRSKGEIKITSKLAYGEPETNIVHLYGSNSQNPGTVVLDKNLNTFVYGPNGLPGKAVFNTKKAQTHIFEGTNTISKNQTLVVEGDMEIYPNSNLFVKGKLVI